MLARHLLFIATRRPQNGLLAISSESIPPQAIVQPPPYVAPPKPEDRQKSQKYQEILRDSQPPNLLAHPEKESSKRQVIAQDQKPEAHDPRQQKNTRQYDNRGNPLDQQQAVSNYEYQQRARGNCQTVHIYNARNQQFYPSAGDAAGQQQFNTLPTRRPQREAEPPRSVTPDITRGLARGSLSSMHILAKQSQPRVTESDHQSRCASHVDARKTHAECTEARGRSVQSQPQSGVDVKNRFATPLSLAALGYRFFASSPAGEPLTKSPSTDALQNNPISPIGRGDHGNGFRSSTPTNHHHGRSALSMAERLALSASNCSSPAPTGGSSGRSTPVQTSSGRTTPTNLILSPTKSTMSNEELFAAIHKSKKRLNMKLNDDNENLSPYGSMSSLVKATADSRYSWSPESQQSLDIPTTVQSPTSRMDFKRLLLQQSVKASPIRLSAAEQLKLSRQQCQQQQSSPSAHHQNSLTKVLSPRTAWRFQTPRTDVLSSTIIEDTAAEEKAMKPSPENTSPISRLSSKRQLDLGDHRRVPDNEVAAANNSDRLIVDNTSANGSSFDSTITSLNQNNRIHELITSTPNNSARITSPARATVTGQDALASKPDSAMQRSRSTTELKKQDCPLSALESRRISNQLARAQFLASIPTSVNPSQNLFAKRFRARSESPQHVATKNVVAPRSPSAPTLETAL